MTPDFVNSDSPYLEVCCWAEALLSSDIQYKSATQGTMIVALKLAT